MAEVVLVAEARRGLGSSESRRLRSAGKVPAVLYGHGIEPQSLTVDARALRGALNQEAGLNALLALEVDSATHLAMARQLQRHPVRGSVMHVDFVIVRRDEVIAAEVPIRLEGEPVPVARGEGLVEQQLFSLQVHAKPGDIPPHIDVDIAGMQVGDAVRVGDLALPQGVTTEIDPEDPVVVLTPSTISAEIEEEEAAAEAEAAAAEAEAAEAPEGAEAQAEGGGEAGSAEG
jgi:large subunit ribosomal protein L25